ncbi:MAG TPA: hypothetical protein VKX17_12045 [Planctomycetota bacterium]|nr:hypothetical protein [Planctomycetota bacterium]
MLFDFESADEFRAWEFKQKSAQLSDKHVTHGKSALAISANEYMANFRNQDWSGFDSLDMDVFAETDGPVAVSLLIADQAWRAKDGSYWNRYNGAMNLSPGANTLSIPVGGLYRGEAGSRNNDLKSNIEPKTIIRFDLGFSTKSGKGTLYLDHMRLTKESRPDGVLAFDFGPENQVLAPGFTAVTWSTVYKKGVNGYGLRFAAGGPNSARDDTFPTRLYQDFVMMDGNEFLADVPDGLYHVWLAYDDCGYWGGEEARFKKRSVSSDGKVLWSEERDPADYLYHFENVEPLPGQSVWDLYMKYLFEPKRFDVTVKEGLLRLHFDADGALGCKVAGLIVYPDSKKADGEKYVAEVEARNRAELEAKAVFMGPKQPADAPAQKEEVAVGPVPLEKQLSVFDGVGEHDAPAMMAARGQSVSTSFAVRTTKNFPEAVTLVPSALKNESGKLIDAGAIDCRVVRHAVQRTYNSLSYTISGDTLRPVNGAKLLLQAGITRQFWITVKVPKEADGGSYAGVVLIKAGELSMEVPIALDVVPIALDEPDFAFGPIGLSIPDEIVDKPKALRQLLTLLKENGMNAFSGGPNIHFNGLDPDGKPKLDFSACDEFMRICREVGFTKELMSYGGPCMVNGLHESHSIGEAGRNWEKKTGKPLGELLGNVWGAVDAHAKQANWLPVMYDMVDEPRVAEAAREQLALLELYRKHAPFVDIGGSYSVDWKKNDAFETVVQDIFKTLNWSSLNVHTQTDLDKARELNKRLYIYNQGTSRYSFGAYQWSEFRKGIRGRMQWHLLALHGWQFFNLDGREPDAAMINWGRNEVIPTLNLARCREGADDFRFAVTLWNLAEKKKDLPAARAAQEWLDGIAKQIAPGENRAPAEFMSDDDFRRGCADRIRGLLK